jgi:hypothetical protein
MTDTAKTVARIVKQLRRAFPGSFLMPRPRPTRQTRTQEPDSNGAWWTDPPEPPTATQVAAKIAGYPKCQICRRPLCLG